MIDYKALTDLELAILTYAVEYEEPDEDEEISKERYKMFKEIYDKLHEEYYGRKLDYSMFSDGGEFHERLMSE